MLIIVTQNNGEYQNAVFDLSHKENVEKHYQALVDKKSIKSFEVVIPS